jgi:hypothetical protein
VSAVRVPLITSAKRQRAVDLHDISPSTYTEMGDSVDLLWDGESMLSRNGCVSPFRILRQTLRSSFSTRASLLQDLILINSMNLQRATEKSEPASSSKQLKRCTRS